MDYVTLSVGFSWIQRLFIKRDTTGCMLLCKVQLFVLHNSGGCHGTGSKRFIPSHAAVCRLCPPTPHPPPHPTRTWNKLDNCSAAFGETENCWVWYLIVYLPISLVKKKGWKKKKKKWSPLWQRDLWHSLQSWCLSGTSAEVVNRQGHSVGVHSLCNSLHAVNFFHFFPICFCFFLRLSANTVGGFW